MIDLGNTLGLGAVVFVLIEAVSKIAPNLLTGKWKIPVAYLLALAAVFLISSSSTFSPTVLINNVAIDKVDVATKFLVALFVAATAVGINIVVPGSIKAVANIGQNQDAEYKGK